MVPGSVTSDLTQGCLQDTLNRPIASAPGSWIDVLERTPPSGQKCVVMPDFCMLSPAAMCGPPLFFTQHACMSTPAHASFLMPKARQSQRAYIVQTYHSRLHAQRWPQHAAARCSLPWMRQGASSLIQANHSRHWQADAAWWPSQLSTDKLGNTRASRSGLQWWQILCC